MNHSLRRIPSVAALIALVLGAAGQARAGLIFATGAEILYSGSQVTFTTPDNQVIGTYPGQGISASLTGLSSSIDLTYDTEFDYFGQGLRLSERIVNNTGRNLASLTITLSGTTANFFNDIYSPALVTIDDTSDPKQVHVVRQYNAGGIILGADSRSITFNFSTPVAVGETFGVHIPIQYLNDSGGTFTLGQTAIATPEPGTIAMAASALPLGLVFWLKRRRMAAKITADAAA